MNVNIKTMTAADAMEFVASMFRIINGVAGRV